MSPLRRILLVDDEQPVLDALRRQLRLRFNVFTASSGEEALELLERERRFHVLVADMRMPAMDGVEFLRKARVKCPDAVRMMLTGNTDQETAVEALNKGAIFRFLAKPCDTDTLIEAICACGRQHDLLVAERELLEGTLLGAVKVLMEVLSAVHPESFGRAQEVKTRTAALCRRLGMADTWEAELAALFSRIGMIVVPPEIARKACLGGGMSEREKRVLAEVPSIGANLLANIPRLEGISRIVKSQELDFAAGLASRSSVDGERIPLEARVIRVLNDLTDLEHRGLSTSRAFYAMTTRPEAYDPAVLQAAEELFSTPDDDPDGVPVSPEDLQVGMKLKNDVLATNGALVVSKGTVLSAPTVERIRNQAAWQGIREPIVAEPPPGSQAA